MITQNSKLKTQKHSLKLKSKITFAFLIAILTFNFCLLPSLPARAYAEEVSLRLSPTLIKIHAQSPSDISSPLIIENMSDSSVTLGVQLKLFKAGSRENGEIEYLADKDNHSDIFNNVHIADNKIPINSLSLGPKQKKELQIEISIPEDAAHSDYYFSVVFTTNSNSQAQNNSSATGQESFTVINAGIANNILLSVGPESDVAANIEDFSAPPLVDEGPISFNIKLQNNTSKYITPKGNIFIKNMFGQTIGKVDIPAQNILANSSRYLSNQSLQTTNYKLQTNTVWPEKFLLGFYTADLNIELSPNGPVLTKSIHFTAFPGNFVAGIIVFAVIFLIIYRRVRSKMP